MGDNFDKIIFLLKKYARIFLSISFGVFLFVLFFELFNLDSYDSNERLILVAGLGLIVFILMALVRIVLPIIIKYNQSNNEPVSSYFLGVFSLFAFISVAFVFYLQYVANIEITYFIVFKIVLVSFIPSVILAVYDNFTLIKEQNKSLVNENNALRKQIKNQEKDYLKKIIEFVSESGKDSIKLAVSNVVLVSSADNYVEIVYKEGDSFKKKLLRNKLKNIEQQIKTYTNFIRCHRTCIVNTLYIDKLNKDQHSHWLSITGYDSTVPVSRQYLIKLREYL